MNAGVVAAIVLGWLLGGVVNYLGDVLPRRRSLVRPFCLHCQAEQSSWFYFLWPAGCRSCGRQRAWRAWVVHGAGIDEPDVRGGLGESAGFRDTKFTDLYPFVSVSGAIIEAHKAYVDGGFILDESAGKPCGPRSRCLQIFAFRTDAGEAPLFRAVVDLTKNGASSIVHRDSWDQGGPR